MIEEARQQVGEYSLETIPIFLLALKIYVAKDMEMPLLKTFSDMLPVLEFYFGQESMLHAFVYTVVASYYSKRVEEDESSRAHKVVTFYEHALNIALKLYGQKGVEVADIYLNRASAFISLVQYDNFQKDIQNALKIYKGHSKSAPKIVQCNHLIGRVKCLEGEITLGIELMEMSSKQYMKMYNYMESLYILFEMLPFLQYKESELEVTIFLFRAKLRRLFRYVSLINQSGLSRGLSPWYSIESSIVTLLSLLTIFRNFSTLWILMTEPIRRFLSTSNRS